MATTEVPAPLSALADNSDDTLSWLTHAVVDALPGVEYASVTLLGRDEDPTTVGATDPLALKADCLQYELDEGPCLSAARDKVAVRSFDAVADGRWPAYAARIAELGMRSQAAVPIPAGGDSLGSLNLYGTRPGQLDREDLRRAAAHAAQAASALLLRRQVETLTETLTSRRVIGQAIGVVMERYGLDEERAFQYLVRVSQTSNVKLRQVARELVEEANYARRQSEAFS